MALREKTTGSGRHAMRQIVALLVLCAAISIPAGGGVSAAELVMFESQACPWCEAWDEEIGEIYRLTDEARIAPLRRVDIDDPLPEDLGGIRAVVYTPTFVLVEDGKEIGRILGYPGENFFWGLLGIELKKLARLAMRDDPDRTGVADNRMGIECRKDFC